MPIRPNCSRPLLRASGMLLAALALAASGLRAQEGGIEVFAGETLFENGWRVSLTELYKQKNDLFAGGNEIADPLDRSFREARTVLGLDYGIDRRFTLTALVPHVDRQFQTGGQTFSTSGLGDIALLAKYRLMHREGHGTAFNWAVLAGVELPTGASEERRSGTLLPAAVQSSTGATNPFAATSATADYGRARFDGTLFYKANTEGSQGLDRGDFFVATLSTAYRFVHYRYPGPTVAARIGLQYRYQGRSRQAGSRLPNSGADELLLLPGLSIHPVPRIDLTFGARIPLALDYNGQQLGRDVEYILAFGIRF